MGSFSGSKSTSTSGPAAYTQPYVQNALDQTGQAYTQQQPALDAYGTIAGMGGAALAQNAFQTSPYVDNAQGAARAISNGYFLGGNPGASTYARLSNPQVGQHIGPQTMLGGFDAPTDGGPGQPSSLTPAFNFAAGPSDQGTGLLTKAATPANDMPPAIGSPTGGMRMAGGPMAANDPSIGLLKGIATGTSNSPAGDTLNYLSQNGGGANPADKFATAVAQGQYLNNQPSSGLYSNLMSSQYLQGNPYLDNIINQTNANATKAVNQRFGASGLGAGISTAYGGALGSALANNEGQLRYQNYNDAANRQLQAAGQSDQAFAAERGQMSNQTGLLASNVNAQADRGLAAAQAQQAQQLAAAQALASQYNAGQDRSLAAAQAGDTQYNAQVAQMLQALGLTGQLSDAQYAGVQPTLAALTAGGVIPQAGINAYDQNIANLTGATNSSTSKSSGPGFYYNTIGNLALGASDRRLKMNIEKVGALDDGLPVYEWDYVWGGPRARGVMADEVAKLRPWALGPEIGGYATVDYGAL